MLSQLAQWQQSRKVFFLLATPPQWKEKFQWKNASLFRGLFEKLVVFQTMNMLGQISPEQQKTMH